MAGRSEDTVRVARFDVAGSDTAAVPRGAGSTARLDAIDAAAEPDATPTAAFDEPPDPVRPAGPLAELASPGAAAAPARVAELGAADGRRSVAAPTARLGAGGARHPGALLIVQQQSDPPQPGFRPDDQQRRRSGVGGRRPARAAEGPAGSDAGAETAPPPRSGGPKQIDPGADPVAAAREICLRLLTDRARTRHELAQALRQRGVPDDAAGSVLERFDEVGLIDDAAFAGQWVRSRHNHRGLARRAIAMELRRKGVDGEVAEEALGEVDADAESRRARELVDRKLRSLTVDTPEQRAVAVRRLVGMLARKGYGAGTAYGVVREALAAHGAEADELGAEPVDD